MNGRLSLNAYNDMDGVKLLQDYDVKISITENGDPFENAITERLNGIMKQEYLETYHINNHKYSKALLKKAVYLYNNERPHMSIGWNNYYQKNPTI